MDYSEIIKKLLENRLGKQSDEELKAHLLADYESLSSPDKLSDVVKGVKIFLEAISNNDKVVIYADYDADGIPGAAILADFLTKIGYQNFEVYFPNRITEGYGIHKSAISYLYENGGRLLITIDVGISEVENIKYAKDLGFKVIVTDHHEPLEILPPADALVNPKLGNYPDRMICGAATIFQFIRAVLKENNFGLTPGQEKWWLDLVAVATLSDMVPLRGDNRIFAKWGMHVLNKLRRPAFSHFSKTMIGQKKIITETDLVFSLTPKINAASRMAHPVHAFNWLASSTLDSANRAYSKLLELDDKRKKLVLVSTKQADSIAKNKLKQQVLVVGREDFHPGILSLLSGKLGEKHKKPVFVWAQTDANTIKGSCRGYGEISVLQLLNSLPAGLLKHYGGHHQAAGFSLEKSQVFFLEQELLKAYQLNYAGTIDKSTSSLELVYDLELDLKDINKIFYDQLRELAPFGQGYEKPVFLFDNVTVKQSKMFGAGKRHFEIVVTDGLVSKRFIKFNYDGFMPNAGETVSLTASLEHDSAGYGEPYFGMLENLQKK